MSARQVPDDYSLAFPTDLFLCNTKSREPMKIILRLKETTDVNVNQLIRLLVHCGASVSCNMDELSSHSIILVDHNNFVTFDCPAFYISYVHECLKLCKVVDINEYRQENSDYIAQGTDCMEVVYTQQRTWEEVTKRRPFKAHYRTCVQRQAGNFCLNSAAESEENVNAVSLPQNRPHASPDHVYRSFELSPDTDSDSEIDLDSASQRGFLCDKQSSSKCQRNAFQVLSPDTESSTQGETDVDPASQTSSVLEKSSSPRCQDNVASSGILKPITAPSPWLEVSDSDINDEAEEDSPLQLACVQSDDSLFSPLSSEWKKRVACMSIFPTTENIQELRLEVCGKEKYTRFVSLDVSNLSNASSRGLCDKVSSAGPSALKKAGEQEGEMCGKRNNILYNAGSSKIISLESPAANKRWSTENQAVENVKDVRGETTQGRNNQKIVCSSDENTSDTIVAEPLADKKLTRHKEDTYTRAGGRHFLAAFDSDEEDVQQPTTSQTVSKRPRQPYTAQERYKIMKYIAEHGEFYRVKGRELWQIMERRKVCPSRTWQSMKEHFLKKIVHDLDSYDFLTKDHKRKLQKHI